MTDLSEYLKSHPSKKKVIVPYEDGNQVRNFWAEQYILTYDRVNGRIFISLPNSMKREEIE